MQRSVTLVFTGAIIAALCTSLSAQINVTVGRNIMVSRAQPGWEHVEYMADGDPADANRIMVCSMRFSQAKNQLTSSVYITLDGGRNWSLSKTDDSSRFGGVWDPACSYGVNNDAFFVDLPGPETSPTDLSHHLYESWLTVTTQGMSVYRSQNSGKTWNAPVGLNQIDHEDLKIDRTAGQYRGRMYLYGYTPASVWLVYSTDNGRTWTRSAESKPDGFGGIEGAGTILPDGTLLIPYRYTRQVQDQPSQSTDVAVVASTDGGEHINSPTVVSSGDGGSSGWMSMSSDHSAGPFRGRAYMAWSKSDRGRLAAFVSHTEDKGNSWSPPARVSDEPPLEPGSKAIPRLFPQIVVNRAGVVGVSWYSFSKRSAGQRYQLRFSASLDGGETWAPSVAVSTHGFAIGDVPTFSAGVTTSGGGSRTSQKHTDDVDVWVWPSARGYYDWNSWPGDYVGIAAGSDGTFHTFWIDNRTGGGELFTSRVMVRGTVGHSVQVKLAGLENVTSSLEVQYTSSVWNAKTKSLLLKYQILNTSSERISGPVKIRVLGLESDLGRPTLMVNGRTAGSGAVLDHPIPPNGLAPGQTTEPRSLVVRFDKVNQLHSIQLRDVVHMKVEVYGKRIARPGS